MRRCEFAYVIAAAALAGLAACGRDSTSPAALISDAQVTADVAASAGATIAGDVAALVGDEIAIALPNASVGIDLFGARSDSVTLVRTRTCYDAADAVVANCALLTTRRIVFHVTMDGVRTGAAVTGRVHRARDWTLTRNFDAAAPPVEVSRTHDGVGTSHDTLTYVNAGTGVTRVHLEAAVDSVLGVTWTLPRLTHPWPVAGSVVRNVTVHVTADGPTSHESRDMTRRVAVDFPPDAQGNVVLHVNALTCNLNLLTHAVTGCH
jgi:hypothetical protein